MDHSLIVDHNGMHDKHFFGVECMINMFSLNVIGNKKQRENIIIKLLN